MHGQQNINISEQYKINFHLLHVSAVSGHHHAILNGKQPEYVADDNRT